MKIKDWIILGLLFSAAVSSKGLAETKSNFIETLDQIEQGILNVSPDTGPTRWKELEKFQEHLWKALALDPGPGSMVPFTQVPKQLFAAELTTGLVQELEALKSSTVPKNFRMEAEFTEYVQTVEKILEWRKARQFPQARAIAKRGTLDAVLYRLNRKQIQNASSMGGDSGTLSELAQKVQGLKNQMIANSKEAQKKAVFGNGNHFVWYAIIALFGFAFGIVAYRTHPDFFQKVLNQVQNEAPATTTQYRAKPLDYARWLKEFEEILTRLKSSQLTHERRIEDLVENSGKITQNALSLYGDARIKCEANLEHRMSTLLGYIQGQTDQGRKLQGGDRIQFNLMLDHCLNLCDAIESNSIFIDRNQIHEVGGPGPTTSHGSHGSPGPGSIGAA